MFDDPRKPYIPKFYRPVMAEFEKLNPDAPESHASIVWVFMELAVEKHNNLPLNLED